MKAAISAKDYDEDGDVHFNVIPDPKFHDLLNLQSSVKWLWKLSAGINLALAIINNGVTIVVERNQDHIFLLFLLLRQGTHVRVTSNGSKI